MARKQTKLNGDSKFHVEITNFGKIIIIIIIT